MDTIDTISEMLPWIALFLFFSMTIIAHISSESKWKYAYNMLHSSLFLSAFVIQVVTLLLPKDDDDVSNAAAAAAAAASGVAGRGGGGVMCIFKVPYFSNLSASAMNANISNEENFETHYSGDITNTSTITTGIAYLGLREISFFSILIFCCGFATAGSIIRLFSEKSKVAKPNDLIIIMNKLKNVMNEDQASYLELVMHASDRLHSFDKNSYTIIEKFGIDINCVQTLDLIETITKNDCVKLKQIFFDDDEKEPPPPPPQQQQAGGGG